MLRMLAGHVFTWRNTGRVGLALGLLTAGKVLNVQVPFLFKEIVDSLNAAAPTVAQAIPADLSLWTVAGTVLLGCLHTEEICF